MGGPIETDVIVLGVGTCGEDASLQLLDAGLEMVIRNPRDLAARAGATRRGLRGDGD